MDKKRVILALPIFMRAGLEVHQISNGKGTHWAVADERDFSGRHHGTGHRIRNRLIMGRTIGGANTL
jgi:hypothetical protein